MTELSKIPRWFIIAAAVALLWNLMGVGAYISQITMSDEAMAALKPEERKMYQDFPLWANIAFALAVFAGSLGCIGLLMKKKWALTAFIASLIGVVVQMIYNVFISGAMEVYGLGSMLMPLMILVIAIVLIWLSRRAIAENWIA